MAFRSLVAALVIAAVALAAVAVASARTDAPRTLNATVGPGFSISLKMGGKAVKSLPAGSYKVVVADKSSFHGFTLERETGGKFEKLLSPISFVGTKTAIVALKAGKWKFYCPAHEPSMFGFFTVK